MIDAVPVIENKAVNETYNTFYLYYAMEHGRQIYILLREMIMHFRDKWIIAYGYAIHGRSQQNQSASETRL